MERLRANDPRHLGSYTVLGRLGEGGQGTVYLGSTPAGNQVAIKLLRADLADDHAARARFVKELAASMRVGPACTARVLEADVEGARPYVVSEYVDGPSLQQLVAGRGPLAGADLEQLATGMLVALEAVHAAGIVHRDFKPANVLVDADGPRVIDFGIARALDATATLTSKVIGTPAYMAPEQFAAESGPAGPAADMFAWAATVVYAATGRAPFGTDSVPQVMHRILYGPPDLTGFPQTPLLRVVAGCLHKDPRQRPTVRQALTELSGDVGDTRALRSPSHLPPAAPPRPRLGRGRRTLVAATGALSVVLVGALIWAGMNLFDGDPGQTAGNQPTGSSASTPKAGPAAGLRLPGTRATVESDPDGEVTLTSFRASRNLQYLWNDRAGRFDPVRSPQPFLVVRASPDGRWAAGSFSFQAGKDFNYVALIDRNDPAPEKHRVIRPPDSSLRLHRMQWSPDGKHLLILVMDNDTESPETRGLLLVTPGSGLDGKFLPLKDRSTFAWLPNSVGFAVNVDPPADSDEPPDIEFYNLQGRLHDTGGVFPEAGWLSGSSLGYGAISPSGKKLVTSCGGPEEPATACVYDMEQTVPVTFRLNTAEIVPVLVPIGFYDETHLITVEKREDGSGSRVVVLTLEGRFVKTLVNNPDDIALEFSVSSK